MIYFIEISIFTTKSDFAVNQKCKSTKLLKQNIHHLP